MQCVMLQPQALEAASQAAETARQSEAHSRKLFETMQDELCAEFDEDRVADESRRGQVETRVTALERALKIFKNKWKE